MTKKELSLAGALLYACEGTKLRRDKRGKNTYYYSIELTNSSSEIIQLFMRFLREVIKSDMERVKGQLFIYEDQNESLVMDYWSKVSGIKKSNFNKNVMFKAKTGKFKPSPYGTFKIRYTDKLDFLKLQEIIDDTWRGARVVE